MMAEDAEAVDLAHRPRCMLESRGRGRGGRGCGQCGDGAPSQQTQGGANTSHAHEAGTRTQAEVPATPRSQQGVSTPTLSSPSQVFLAGLNSLGFQDLMEQILLPSDGYMPEFDGTQFDVYLNEHVSSPSQFFSIYAGSFMGDVIACTCACSDCTRISHTYRAS
ncbi:hypothetical protein PIB30_060901 [Stylosanthes scabra]|uniref:Uncharacterized protein n=1 Tax=Stylosanthes scabra TaxID=79078 RepID=A0ABU6WKK7_9FABA|nr:hypothetical protein [Stylosanthes scabra]